MSDQLGELELKFLREVERGGRVSLATREIDRARQRCRRAGLVLWEGTPKKWRLTGLGKVALFRAGHDAEFA